MDTSWIWLCQTYAGRMPQDMFRLHPASLPSHLRVSALCNHLCDCSAFWSVHDLTRKTCVVEIHGKLYIDAHHLMQYRCIWYLITRERGAQVLLFQLEYAERAGAVGAGCHIYEGLKREADHPTHSQRQLTHLPFYFDSTQRDV